MANANSADPRDDTVKEVMDELRAEGHTFVGDEPPKEEPKPQEAKPEPKVEKPEPQPARVEEAPAPEVEEPKEEPKPEAKERRSKYVPVQKANQWRHDAQSEKARADALEQELNALKTGRQVPKEETADWKSEAKQLAQKHGLDEAAVADLVAVVTKAVPRGIDPEIKSEIEALRSVKVKYEADAEEAAFREDLSKTLTEFPELKGQETGLKELAYSQGNEKVPLRLLALQLRHELNLDRTPQKTAEAAGSPPKAEAVDYSEMSEDRLRSLSDEEFDKFIRWQEDSARVRLGKFR